MRLIEDAQLLLPVESVVFLFKITLSLVEIRTIFTARENYIYLIIIFFGLLLKNARVHQFWKSVKTSHAQCTIDVMISM